MSRRHDKPTRKFHSLIYSEDLDFLEARFGLNGDKPIGVGTAVRLIVHKRVRQIKAALETQRDESRQPVEEMIDGK